jgi:hypothetical protein
MVLLSHHRANTCTLAYWHTGILAYWHTGILAYTESFFRESPKEQNNRKAKEVVRGAEPTLLRGSFSNEEICRSSKKGRPIMRSLDT